MESIANSKLVQRLVQKLNAIDIDFVSDNNQLKVLLRESGMPTMYATERPDKVVEALSEGKIVVLLNGSPYVLLMPMFFPDFFKTSDDYYQHFAFTLFNRIIRGIAFFLSHLFTRYFCCRNNAQLRQFKLATLNYFLCPTSQCTVSCFYRSTAIDSFF